MKIGAVFTGGTIGSCVGTDGFITVERSYRLLDMYYEKYDKERRVEFVTEEPYTILSENLDFSNILSLCDTIRRLPGDLLDGIVIMHGTDTLQYTAAFLFHMLGDIRIPIVLVSSAYVLDDERANGLPNFKLALDFIENIKTTGVYVSYVNSDGHEYVHRADRLLAHSAFDSDVYSMKQSFYAERIDGAIVKNRMFLEDCGRTVTGKAGAGRLNRIAFVHIYPGMSDVLNIEHVDAILLESYHSGTLSVENCVKQLALKARETDKPIYIVGIDSEASQYETVKKYSELGIIPLYDEAPISAFCRLSCLRRD